jgi:hypothetical protein
MQSCRRIYSQPGFMVVSSRFSFVPTLVEDSAPAHSRSLLIFDFVTPPSRKHKRRPSQAQLRKMFTIASRITSIASRNCVPQITRRRACSNSNAPSCSCTCSCSCVKELKQLLELKDAARLGYNYAQRMLRRVDKQKYSTDNMTIIRNAYRREKYNYEREILRRFGMF